MINYDYKKHFVYAFADNKKGQIAFGNRGSVMFYDDRTKQVFRKLAKHTDSIKNYYFTDAVMKRINKIDLSKCYPTKLGYLFDKHPDEIGVCITKEDYLGFIYAIGATDIQLLVTTGVDKRVKVLIDEYGKENYGRFEKACVGACVISYSTNTPSILPNSLLYKLFDTDLIKQSAKMPLERGKLQRIAKEMKYLKDGQFASLDFDVRRTPLLFGLKQEYEYKRNKIWEAIRMFIFLKTAKVVDKTFISDSNCKYKPSKQDKRIDVGVTVIDSHWNESINVVNPFAVSGHFRNQPKKNMKGEWYKEIIYIDSFMKTGYRRRAVIENLTHTP